MTRAFFLIGNCVTLYLCGHQRCVCAHRHGEMFALGSFDGHTTDE